MQKAAHRTAQASDPNAQLKARITKVLKDLVKKDPEQKKNAEEAQSLVNLGRLPNSRTPILYAIGGKAGLATIPDYGKILQSNLKKDPNVKKWSFASCTQLMAGAKPTPPASSTSQSQLAAYAWFDKSREPSLSYAHEIIVEFRFPRNLGGDGTVVRRAATLNDTGSNVQSLHRSDWNALNTTNTPTLDGSVQTAIGGPWDVENVLLEMRVVKPEVQRNAQGQLERTGRYIPLTIWYVELLRIVNDDETLLSGQTMRDYLYFATAPGNDRLLVSQRKQAIIDGLPVEKPPTV